MGWFKRNLGPGACSLELAGSRQDAVRLQGALCVEEDGFLFSRH